MRSVLQSNRESCSGRSHFNNIVIRVHRSFARAIGSFDLDRTVAICSSQMSRIDTIHFLVDQDRTLTFRTYQPPVQAHTSSSA